MAGWDVAFTQTLSADQTAMAGYTLVSLIPAGQLSKSGSKIRLRLEPPGATDNTVITSMYVGHKAASGDAYDFDGNQAQMTVGSSGAFTLTVGGGNVTTDDITLAVDNTKDLLIAFHCQASPPASRVRKATALTSYYRNLGATDDAGTTNKNLYTTLDNYFFLVNQIEVYG